MGATHVTVTVRNITDEAKSWSGLFLVDTGATDCLVPASALRGIGIEPVKKRVYELADGRETEYEIGFAILEFMGDITTVSVIFGPDDAEPLLGVLALESVGIEVDPRSQKLKRLPALRLKTTRGK